MIRTMTTITKYRIGYVGWKIFGKQNMSIVILFTESKNQISKEKFSSHLIITGNIINQHDRINVNSTTLKPRNEYYFNVAIKNGISHQWGPIFFGA